MFDWFDPGSDEEDLTGMCTTMEAYAIGRLTPISAALDSYRATGGSYHYTILRAGMKHTAFTDLPWLSATSEATRARYREYLDVIRRTVRTFFDHTLQREPAHLHDNHSMDGAVLIQYYEPTGRP